MKKIGIIGVGAVGTVIAEQLYSYDRENFYVLASGSRFERLQRDGLKLNDDKFFPRILDYKNESKKLDLLIIAVKNYDLETVLEEIKNVVSEDTCILPLLNGVTAVEKIRDAYPKNKVLYGIVMRTDADRVGRSVTCKVKGEIQIGYEVDNKQLDVYVDEVYNLLINAGVNVKKYDDIKRMQWKKWLVNIGANQVSVVAHAEFKYFGKVNEIVELMRVLMMEILMLAKAENIDLTEEDVEEAIQILINYPPMKKTSMLQDIQARRRTEIDSFAGTVVEKGKEHNISTPYNYALYLAIKAHEKVYTMREQERER